MSKVRIEIHLTEEETKALDQIASADGRSRKNLCETEIRKLVKTRHEEEREHLAWCKKKLEEVPEKNKPFWRGQIRRSKKFLYGG